MADQKAPFVTEITPRSEDFSRWYLDLVRRAELADYSPVKGCMVIRPYGYAIWEHIQRLLDARLKATGHVNAYFPLFIPESLLNKEKDHVEGFAPQVAWVTKGGDEDLEERLVVRPTSEVIFGTMYAKWIKSWRDLPVLINQWANVVRWEKVTRPFLRTTEFLWQEGHTAHETAEEAEDRDARDPRALQGIRRDASSRCRSSTGIKSDSEKFAGASRTYSIEALMGDGRALQAGTSHNLGQNFAKVFDIQFQGRDKSMQYVWTTSWGMTTRLIGAIIMTHGDDSGLILPPRVAPVSGRDRADSARQLERNRAAEGRGDPRRTRGRGRARQARRERRELARMEVRRVGTLRRAAPARDRSQGHREGAGIFGPTRHARESRDPARGAVRACQRDSREIQASLLQRALAFREAHTTEVSTWAEFKTAMEGRPGFVIAPWCGDAECEAAIKAETRRPPQHSPGIAQGRRAHACKCGRPAAVRAWFAKSY